MGCWSVITENSRTKSDKHDTSNSSGTYITHVVDAYIRPVNDQVPFVEVQLTAQHNVLANEQQYTEQSEPIYDTYLLVKDSKHFFCSTCHKCVFNANHDACITKFLKEVNSRAKVQSPKTKTINKSVEPKSHTQKPGRQIAIGQRFSPKKSSVVHQKSNTPRSCPRWKPTGRIFKIASLRWIPTGKMFTDNTTRVDSEPSNGSNDDITNSYECDQTLNVSAGTTNLSAGSSKGSGITPEVPDELKDNSAVVTEKQAGNVQTNLTMSSAKLEIQSMVDVPIHQEDLAVQRTPLIDPVISMWIFNALVHSLCALSTLRCSGLRMASAAAKPCQGDSSEFYLITGRIPDGSSCWQETHQFTTPCSHFIFLIKDIMITERPTTQLPQLWMIKRSIMADDLKESSKITQVKGTMLKSYYIMYKEIKE
ncbi:hypothetical protein Tco_0678138 [Tanacetum coccineum]|uniref:Uncharacterized protein n=1 Tax=Tanacetum coccineum TaxID=301880 RepID=A0ABQ4XE57_9ASTR